MANSNTKFNRIWKDIFLAIIFITIPLILFIFGYRYLTYLNWLDSFYNASLLISGLGPVSSPSNTVGKLFVSFSALFVGAFYVIILGYIVNRIIMES